MRFRSVITALLLAGASLLPGCTSPTPDALSAPRKPVTTVWMLEQADQVGGYPTLVVGNPRPLRDEYGLALAFDGANDGIILPTVALAGLRQFTIELLIRPAAGGAEQQRFFHTQDSAGNRSLLEIRLLPHGQWTLETFLLSGKNSLPLLDRTLLHPAEQWHWVALRYDGQRMTSFVNGKQELTGEVEFPPMRASGQTSIGVRLNQVYWFKGGIREIRIHPMAISATQLAP